MPEATRPASITCARCGVEKKVGRTGPIPTYCSASCRAQLSAERAKQDGRYEAGLTRMRQLSAKRRESTARPCPYCGESMTHPRRVQCGADACKRRYYADLQAARSRAIFEATGQWPHRRYAEQQREYGRRQYQERPHWRIRYPERAALVDARRRMRVELASQAEPVVPADVHARDQWTCQLCGLPIDPEVAWPSPMSASVDHIVPLSRGGSHSIINVQSAHLGCNSRKGDKITDQIETIKGS
ncbi:HNH endonuclease [Streptomyces sp. NPDC005349]|uniref:HNH endonuclease n=1 Tax=Streptomyces sp. NPDC005349 TaxID=3157037 RepID=UPI0033B94CAC